MTPPYNANTCMTPDSDDPNINKLIMCFAGLQKEYQGLNGKMDSIDGKLDALKEQLKQNQMDYVELKGRVDSIDREMDEIKHNDLKDVKEDIKSLKRDLKECKEDQETDFKSKVGWIVGGIVALIAILLEIIRFIR